MSKRARKMAERIRKIQSDPSNAKIARVERAGEVVDGHLVMHNGLRVQPMDTCYMQLLQGNRGCHEPQEELVFQEVLHHIPASGCMIELGAYWGFYSLWFAKHVDEARCFLVEPDADHLDVGKYNFALNQLTAAEFTISKVGHGHWGADRFLAERNIDFVDVLHADIQGKEYEMLADADQSLRTGRIGYVFVGTHSQDLHYRCKQLLEARDYVIIADADFTHGTFCADGVLVARHRALPGVESMQLPLREPHQPYTVRQPLRLLPRWSRNGLTSLFNLRKSA
ncbi:MAG: FkbM family methyltransferase [Planctomycetota bacterium]|nr:FkbM family methyltransferase [Planctomycetota bacterium]